MSRILILGGGGLLGHKACQILSEEFDIYVTFRNFDKRLKNTSIFDEKKVFGNADASEFDSIKKIIEEVKPDFVLNCIGIIKQLKESHNPKLSIYINSLFPHMLAEECGKLNSKLIHISTDCAFSGKKGNYTETDVSDAEDLYGRTKYLGEINYGNTLTLRTSIIGHELFTKVSLVEWFISQKNNTVKGFLNAIYTGFPAVTLCREISRIIKSFPELKGLYNISSERINKFDLLTLIKNIYKVDIEITPFENFHCDRSLDSGKFRSETDFKPKSWNEMILEMHEDFLKNNYMNK